MYFMAWWSVVQQYVADIVKERIDSKSTCSLHETPHYFFKYYFSSSAPSSPSATTSTVLASSVGSNLFGYENIPQFLNSWPHLCEIYGSILFYMHHQLWPLLQMMLQYVVITANTLQHLYAQMCDYYEWFCVFWQSDNLWALAIKYCLLIVFIFFMHWLRRLSAYNTANNNNNNCNAISSNKPSNTKCIEPSVIVDLCCDYDCKELQKQNESCPKEEDLLELEEKKRKKRLISKKRKCVSAGPILIAHRSKKKHSKILKESKIILDSETYIPARKIPLTVGQSKEDKLKAQEIADKNEADIVNIYKCVLWKV